jgi:hypothetical protein
MAKYTECWTIVSLECREQACVRTFLLATRHYQQPLHRSPTLFLCTCT